MSTAIPFWNYFWHIFGLVFILLICLPTGYWRKINSRFAVHRTIPPEIVEDMRYGESGLDEETTRQLIQAYNDGNFLYLKSRQSVTTIALTWNVPSRREAYQVCLTDQYVEVIKTKIRSVGGTGTRIFTLQAAGLHNWLAEQVREATTAE